MYTDEEFKKVLSWCWRRAGTKQVAGPLRALVNQSQVIHLEVCKDTTKPQHETACWRYDAATQRHVIEMGINMDAGIKAPHNSIDRRRKMFAQSVVQHECAHGEFTNKDLDTVGKACAADKIPFKLFNMFEDARIEHLYRKKYGGNGAPGPGAFKWELNGAIFAKITDSPERYFYAGIQREASAFKSGIRTGFAPVKWTGATLKTDLRLGGKRKTAHIIQQYYEDVINCPSSMELLALIKNWMKDFPYDKTQMPSMILAVIGEMKDPGEEPGKGNEPPPPDAQTPPPGINDKVINGACNDANEPRDHSPLKPWRSFSLAGLKLRAEEKKIIKCPFARPELVGQVESRLMRILDSTDEEHMEPASDGNLHVPGLLTRNYDGLFTRTTHTQVGTKSLVLIVDLSYSMVRYWFQEGGREFVWAFIRMAQKGHVNLRVFLSGWNRQRGELPVQGLSEAEFRQVCVNGGDGMRDTLRHAVIDRAIRDSNAVVVWTDGDLNDADVGGRQWTRQGIHLIGCSMNTHKAEALRKHFHVVYIDPNPVLLAGRVADAVVEYARADSST